MPPLRLHSSVLSDGPRPDADVHRVRGAGSRPAPREVTKVPLDVETVYRAHADDVARWVRRLGGPDIDVEDAVHEVFVVVQRRVAEWRGEAQITTWLYEIAFRVVRDQRGRWRWRRSTTPGTDLAELAADQPDALDLLQRREATAGLYRILDGVGEKYRDVIILFELEGKSGEEIAALTDTSLSNVRIRLHRARQKVLKRFLAWESRERRK